MKKLFVMACLSLLALNVSAHQAQFEGIVNLKATASVEVETDTMLAVISVEAENYDPAILAENINKKMAWALSTAKQYKDVKVKGGQYTSHQLYNKRVFRAWRGTQSIILESKNSTELGALIGVLQKKLLIKSLRYHVSKEKREQLSKELVKEAIKNFKEQALVITRAFDKNKFVIHQINVNSNNQYRPVYAQHRMMDSVSMAKSAPANLQQSSSTIQVNINGSIRLIK